MCTTGMNETNEQSLKRKLSGELQENEIQSEFLCRGHHVFIPLNDFLSFFSLFMFNIFSVWFYLSSRSFLSKCK